MALISKKILNIKLSPTLATNAKALELKQKGYDIISLSLGEPDLDTPDQVKYSAIKAIVNGFTKYTATEGELLLRQAICNKLKRENNLEYQTDEILVSNGAKQVLYNCLIASIDPADEVIIPAPYWVSYLDMVDLASGTSVIINTKIENNFKITAKQLNSSITNKTKWLILNSPSNPTGALYSKEELIEIAQVLRENPHVHVISDDIYEHIIYDNQIFYNLVNVAQDLKERVLVVNGLSKSHAMTGWRIGYAAGNKELIKAMNVIQSQTTSNACSISQKAAIEALNMDLNFINKNKEIYTKKRDLLISLINKSKYLSCMKPDGAFYIFVSCNKIYNLKTSKGILLKNSTDIANFLLEKAEVAIVQGSAFGDDNFIRMSYATSEEKIIQAMQRIERAFDSL